MTFDQLYETSARENVNVEEMFRAVTKLVLRSKRDQGSGESRVTLYSVLLTFLEFPKLTTNRPTKQSFSLRPQMDNRRGEGGGGRDGNGDPIKLDGRRRPRQKEKGKSNCCK